MSLKNILIETNIENINIDIEDNEYEEYTEQAYDLATNTGLRILRDKELYEIKVDHNKDKVIAALFVTESSESFSFDIAVDRSYENIGYGSELVESALEHYEFLKDVYGEDYKIEVHVINPKMKSILKNKFGFEVQAELSPRESIMTLNN